MMRNRRKSTDPRKRVLREAEDIITKPEVEQSDDITRIGVVWAGILDLDDVIPPTTVAAMLSASQLVMATSTLDSEAHWVGAAAYAAMGAYSEDPDEVDDDGNITTSTKQTVGFGPPSPSQL
jgi:hypothetical protein